MSARTTETPTGSIDESLYPTISDKSWRETLSNALIITRREVRDSFRDWRIIAPILILTFMFPFLAQWIAARFSGYLMQYGAELIGERLIPFMLMIVGFFPISISLVIALETFVGEKERRSLEPLLSTPLTNTELYIGKTLSSMIPPLVASFGGMLLYLLTLVGGELAWRPQVMLVIQIFLLTIVQALVMVTGAVVVSSQTTSTRAANLLASFIIIPMTLLVNAESVIMFLAPDANSPYGISTLWAIIVGMCLVVGLLLRLGNSIFNREELLGRTIDAVNLTGTLKKIWRYVRAVDDDGTTANNLIDWYKRAVPYSLGKLKTPGLITLAIFVTYFLSGYLIGQMPQFQLPLEQNMAVGELPPEMGLGISETRFMGFIIVQNARVLLVSTLLAALSFGVLALIIPPLVFGVLGYLASQVIPIGLGAVLAAGILPHGIVEIPTVLLATAAMLRLGAVITKPPQGQTVGHAWLVAFSDVIKLWLALIIPGLIIGAALEAFVTVNVLQMVIGG